MDFKFILRKIFLFLAFFLYFNSVFSLAPINLYYWDLNSNSKVDKFGIEFESPIKGIIDFTKLQLYSNTGGLSSRKIDSEVGYFSDFSISDNFLYLDLIEQDNEKKDLTINNTTSSDFRLKSLIGIGITDLYGIEIDKFSLSSSFGNYNSSHIFNKTAEVFISNDQVENTGSCIQTGSTDPIEVIEEIGSGSLDNTGSMLENTGGLENSSSGILENSGGLIEIGTGTIDEIFFTGSLDNSGDTNILSGNILGLSGTYIPEINYEFQTPTYLIEKGNDYFECDSSKDECKLNLDLENSFSGYKMSDYVCSLDFGFITGEENKCNPSTIIFGSGFFEVKLKIIDKNNFLNFKEKILNINNLVRQKEIPDPIIEIQSGLDLENTCNKEDCAVNFNGLNSFSGVSESDFLCKWTFPGAAGSSLENTETCNPGYVHYFPGSYSVSLKISDKSDSTNFKEKTIIIKNIYTKIIQTNIISQPNFENISFVPKIIVQGIINAKSKILESKILYCHQDECSVNLDGEIDNKISAKYFWNFGNGDFFEGKNPKSIKYKKGEYLVNLKVIDSYGNSKEDHLSIKVLGNSLKEEKKEEIKDEIINFDEVEKYIRISSVMPNPTGKDDFEWIEIENLGDKDLNISGCKIENKKTKNSKYFSIKKDLFINAYSIRKFYKKETKLILTNSGGIINFLCGEKLIDSMTWDYKAKNDHIVSKYENKANVQIALTGSEIESIKNFVLINSSSGNLLYNIKIKIQGKLSKSKKIVGNIFYCETNKTCSIDFGIDGKKIKNFSYLWDFGNGEKFVGYSPKSYKYNIGKYEVKLVVLDENDKLISKEKMNLNIYKPLPATKKIKTTKAKTVKKSDQKEVDIKNVNSRKMKKSEEINLPLYGIISGFITLFLLFFLVRRRLGKNG